MVLARRLVNSLIMLKDVISDVTVAHRALDIWEQC